MKMTVYFDGVFWLGLIEYESTKGYKAFHHCFGKEPKDEDIFRFITISLSDLLKYYDNFETSISVSEADSHLKKVNPKRMQREINKEKRKPVLNTKAQIAMKEVQEASKIIRKQNKKLLKQSEKEKVYRLKQEKRHQKKKGH